MQDNLHEAQATILKELLFHNGTNFAALNKLGLTSDHFTFHLKQLVRRGILEKKANLYFLTQKGKLVANKLDVETLAMEKFGTPSVAVTAKRIIKGKVQYLIQQRLKEPLYGYYGFINGKVRFGEFSKDTAERELEEETGLSGKAKILMVAHKMRGPSRDDVKLDHFFFLYVVEKPTGKLFSTKEGKNSWKTLEEIRKLRTFPGFDIYIDAVERGTYTPYSEKFIEVKEI